MPRGHPSQGTNTIWRCLPILNRKQSLKPGRHAVFWMDFVTPLKFNGWNLKSEVPGSLEIPALETIIFRFHVKFRGSILFFSRGGSWMEIFVNVDEQVVATHIFFSFIPIWGR